MASLMQKSLINGEERDVICISDRGLLYGDSVFETIAVKNGRCLLLNKHLARLERGLKALALKINSDLLLSEIESFVQQSERAVLRVTITAGSGGRGYARPVPLQCNRLLTLHSWPDNIDDSSAITVGLASFNIARQARLAKHKHGNRLEQVLIRSHWQSDWQEALVFDSEHYLIEATQSNVFLRFGNQVHTPLLDFCGVAGVMREFILDLKAHIPFRTTESNLTLDELGRADELIVCNSIAGVRQVASIDFGKPTSCKTFDSNEFKLGPILKNLLKEHGAI